MKKTKFRIIMGVLCGLILLFCVSLAYMIKSSIPYYRSRALIYVEQNRPKIITQEQDVLTQSKDYLSKDYLYTQCELLKSNQVITKVISQPEIAQMRTFNQVDNKIDYLRKGLEVSKYDVSVGKINDIISVSFASPYPVEAAQIVNEVVSEYIKEISSKGNVDALNIHILEVARPPRPRTINSRNKYLTWPWRWD